MTPSAGAPTEFLAVNLNAIRAAFVEPSVKQALEQRLREQYVDRSRRPM